MQIQSFDLLFSCTPNFFSSCGVQMRVVLLKVLSQLLDSLVNIIKFVLNAWVTPMLNQCNYKMKILINYAFLMVEMNYSYTFLQFRNITETRYQMESGV